MWISSLSLDIRLAIRRLRRSPAFYLGATVTIAVALSASAATFRVWRAIEPADLNVPGGELIQAIGPLEDGVVRLDRGLDVDDVVALKHRLGDIAVASGVKRVRTEVRAGDLSRVRFAELVDADYFQLFLHPLILGRAFKDSDRGAPSVILSDRLAKQLFGDGSRSLGAVVTVAQHPHVVIGVGSPRFLGVSSPSLIGADLWLLELPSTAAGSAAPKRAMVYVRPNRTTLLPVVRSRVREGGFGLLELRHALMPVGLLAAVRGAAAGIGVVTLSMLLVAFVGLLALLVSRAMSASDATHIRQALGATGSQAHRPFIIEGVIVVVTGIVAAVPLGRWLVERLAELSASTDVGVRPYFRIDDGLDVVTPALGLGVCLGLVLIVSRALRSSTLDSFREHSVVLSLVNRSGRSTSRLMGFQVAFSLFLVSLAGVAALGASQTAAAHGWPFGRSPMLARLDLGPMGLSNADRAGLVRRLRNLDLSDIGITATTLSTALPIGRDGSFRSVTGRGSVKLIAVEPDFFEVYSIPMRSSGTLQSFGISRVVVSQAVADWLWPDGSAVGRVLELGGEGRTERFDVVGVADTVELPGATSEQGRQVYQLSSFDAPTRLVLSMRADAIPITVQQVTEALRQRLPGVPIEDVVSVDTELQRESGALVTAARLTIVGAGFSALITLVAVYAVAKVELQSRLKDVGVMMAIGANLSNVVSIIFRPYRKAVTGGVLVGSLACIVVVTAARSMLLVELADVTAVLVSCGLIFALTIAVTLAVPLISLTKESPTLLLRERS